jgi:hypothetical protein
MPELAGFLMANFIVSFDIAGKASETLSCNQW